MPAVALETPRQGRSVLKLSLGITLIVVITVLGAVFLVGAPTADAATCTWSGGSANWTTTANWSGCGGSYPGATVAQTDTATFLSSPTVPVTTALPGIVALVVTGGTPTIDVTGTFPLASASMTSGGTIIAESGGTVTLASTGTLSGGFGTGVTLNGGIFTNDGTISLGSGTTFLFHGGALRGAGNTTFSGTTVTFDGTQGTMTIDSQTVNVNATVTLSGSNALTLNNGAQILVNSGVVAPDGIFSLASDAPINSTLGAIGKIVTFAGSPAGFLQKTGGTSTTISAEVDNNGAISAGGRTLTLSGGGTFGAGSTLDISPTGSILDFAGGAFNVDPTTTILGNTATNLKLSNSATLTLSTAAAWTVPVTFTQSSSSTLRGPGSINLNGVYNFAGGTMDGVNASPSLQVNVLGIMNITGVTASTLTNTWRLVNNTGAINFNPINFGLAVNNGARIDNQGGTFNIANSNGLGITTNNVGFPLFVNGQVLGGNLTKNSTGVSPIGLKLDNYSAINVNAGTLQLNGGGGTVNPNSFNVVSGATLEITTTIYTFSPGTQMNGSGIYLLTSGGLTLSGSETVANFTQTSGTLEVLSSNIFTVSGNLIWNGGMITGFSGNIVKSTGSMSIGSTFPTIVSGGIDLEIAGMATDSAVTTTLQTGSRIVVDPAPAQFNITSATTVASDGTGSFDNSGIVTKSGLGIAQINSTFNQGGLAGAALNVTAGTLNLNGGGTSNGPFNVSTGATLAFTGSGYGLSVGATLNGTGIYSLTSTAFLNVNTALNCPTNFIQDGTSVLNVNSSPFTIGVGSTYKWNGGTIFGGTTNLSGGSLLIDTTASGVTLDGFATLNIGSSAIWSGGTNAFTMKQTSAINISNVFDIRTAGSIVSDTCTGGVSVGRRRPLGVCTNTITVNSGGTLQKTISGGTTIIAADLTNAGTVSVQAGLLALSGGGTVNHTGTFTVASVAILDFSAGVQNIISGSFTGTGIFKLHGATLDVAPNISVANFDFAAGILQGTGNLSSSSAFVWDGGTMTGAGTTSVASGTLTISGANAPMDLIRPLSIGPGVIATYNSPFNRLNVTYPGGSITNSGTFTLATSVPMTLTGTPPAGTYLFINNAGATLNGNGAIGVPLTNNGNLNPGTSPGKIALGSAYTQTANGVFNVELNGTTPITQYDVLAVTGTATLAGTLNVTLGYTPVDGDLFTPLTFGSLSGDFTTKNLPTFPPNGTIQASYTANSLQLLAVAPSSDLGVGKVLSGSLVAGSPAVYTITIKNFGPNDANSVTVTDPTPAGLTFSSNSGACTTPFPCTISLITAGSTATITSTYNVPATASGSVSNTVTVAVSTDFNSANDTSTAGPTAITQNADLSVTKTGPAMANPGTNITYTITVTNNGPSDATGVQLADPTPARLAFVSAGGACASFPCSIGTMTSGQTKTVQANYSVIAGPVTTIVNTATATSSTPDANSANNAGSASTSTGCPTAIPTVITPANGVAGAALNGTLVWTNVGAASYTIFLDVQGPNACSKFFASTTATSLPYAGLQPGTTYQWRVEAVTPGCTPISTPCMTFSTLSTCPITPPTLIAPVNTNVVGNVTFSWSAAGGALDYLIFVNGSQIGKTNATTFGPVAVPSGLVSWFVVAELDPPCGPLTSQIATFNGCEASATTVPSIVGQADSGQAYDLLWDAVAGATKYEADEATDPNFINFSTQSTVNTKIRFQHAVKEPTAFYYRVRAFFACANAFGPNSVTVRVVLAPITAPANPNVSVPAGNSTPTQIIVHIPGFPDGTFPFTATLDPQQPWLISVTPSSGLLPPGGLDFTVVANPAGLSHGTHTGTVIVLVTTPSAGSIVTNGVVPVSAPVSISLVTPITPKPAGTPPVNALIIPSTGHLDGINSRWASDIRVLNTSSQQVRYQLTFTPDDTTKGVKQTIIETAPGATTALDDIVKTWYGVGSLGESSNGALEIRPLDNPAKGTPSNNDVNVSFTTVASSRTFNAASNSSAGTLGEFIPAIAFSNFIGRALDSSHAATILGLQQIAQSDAMRTNLGVMEASGQPVSVLVSVFDGVGKKLLDLPLSLAGGQHAQLNSFLAQNKISLPDGRIEVKVTGGEGKITAYASVIDNKSGDPILISGIPLGQKAFDRFVLAGVADLNTPVAAWRTDMRIFNPSPTPQFTTLTFYPQNGGGSPQTTSMTINPGEVKRLDNTLSSVFGVTNSGGAVHVTTASAAPLVVSGRTYNVTSNGGTFGQLMTAVTSADAIGKGDRPLHILQAEDSVRLRTNVGIFEVTGKPATVEVTLSLPDSKISPSTQIPLPANGFIQVPAIQSFGFSNVYNARITLRVVDGDGRVGGYGSVIDQISQAPTLIPAQQ